MSPATISTILNSAPMVIQGAGKLINLIREQADAGTGSRRGHRQDVESLAADIGRLEERLAAADESSIEQIKLIEQLARQNEALAASMKKMNARLNLMLIAAVLALVLSVAAAAIVLLR